MISLSSLVLKGKLAALVTTGAFAVGAVIGGIGIHKIYNGKIKNDKIKAQSVIIEDLKAKGRADDLLLSAQKSTIKLHVDTIKSKTEENSSYALSNVNLANSRMGSREVIYREGQSIAQEEVKNPANKCLADPVNERLRRWANGERVSAPGVSLSPGY